MASAPVISWRSNTTPFPVITSVALTGNGVSGAINSNDGFSATSTIRVYNNFSAAGSIADALNCQFASYDDTTHQGSSATYPVANQMLLVQVTNYNGSTSGAGGGATIGGSLAKLPVSTNSGTISGSGSNYVTLTLYVIIPLGMTPGSYSQGLWLEYDSTA